MVRNTLKILHKESLTILGHYALKGQVKYPEYQASIDTYLE